MKNYDYELTYAVTREGKEETLLLSEITYDVYKSASPLFENDADKALIIILGAVGEPESSAIALKYITDLNTWAIRSLDHGIGLLTNSVPATIKKKSKTPELDLVKKTV